mmetsp:Transcript_50547/g.90928  ORF Transcript_50547/g.90928 Transcript_50547/m.90928 type:complete len:225 (+) Transcript_50547:308-982(+)
MHLSGCAVQRICPAPPEGIVNSMLVLLPSQSPSWMFVPSFVLPPATSRHLFTFVVQRMRPWLPGGGGVNCMLGCSASLSQYHSWMLVPTALLPAATSTHLSECVDHRSGPLQPISVERAIDKAMATRLCGCWMKEVPAERTSTGHCCPWPPGRPQASTCKSLTSPTAMVEPTSLRDAVGQADDRTTRHGQSCSKLDDMTAPVYHQSQHQELLSSVGWQTICVEP